jgi:predicted nucleotidyltransferase/DNA-binding XRE family transcriptional regulator
MLIYTDIGIIPFMTDVATTLRHARSEADLSQAELAGMAGTSQPALARYETGAALPTLPTLERLLSACGRQLQIDAPRITGQPARASSIRGQLGPHAEKLRRQRRTLLDAAQRHGVFKVRVFGSLARGEAGPESDIDLLVDLKPGTTLIDLAGFRREAAEILDIPVDVATTDMLKERIRLEALTEALPL